MIASVKSSGEFLDALRLFDVVNSIFAFQQMELWKCILKEAKILVTNWQ